MMGKRGYVLNRRNCFPFPFPFDPIGDGKRKRRSGLLVEPIAVGGSVDAAVCDELSEDFSDVTGAHACGLTQVPLRDGCGRCGEDFFDALLRGRLALRTLLGRLMVDDFESERW